MNLISNIFSENSIKNEEIIELSQEEILNNWTIPDIEPKTIYKIGTFENLINRIVKTSEQTICLDSNEKTIKLLGLKDIQKYFTKYKYIHIGLIQIAFKPLTFPGLNASIIATLRDARSQNYKESLMGVIQTSLCHGPSK